jgi:hypothetical protein
MPMPRVLPRAPVGGRAGLPPAAMHQASPAERTRVEDLLKLVNLREWEMFDTIMFGTTAFPGQAAVTNFAQITSPLQFFNNLGRANGVQNGVFCSNSDIAKMDYDFVCMAAGVDVFCPTDVAAAAGIATAKAFIETLVYTAILKIEFGGSPMLHKPITDLPAAGGVTASDKVRLQGVAANSDSEGANNGLADPRAMRMFSEPLLFKKGQAFTCNMFIPNDTAGTAGPVFRLQGLQPLTANLNALVRVKLWGLRGDDVLPGVTSQPDLKWVWSNILAGVGG